ncbi:hypothetical protein IG631_09698 [Alternaria alternata]|nr:hypothetical protein IG631_09698 [Alternaria alternata]
MGFRRSVRELFERVPRSAAHNLRWPNNPLPRTIPNTTPPVDCGPKKLPNADMETGYIRRVHEIAEYLVPSINFGNDFGSSRLPLIQAVGQGDFHWVRQILLKTDIDPDIRDCQGWTALQNACSIKTDSPESRNQEAIIRLLISQGVNVNAAGDESFGRTALQAACERGNERIVDLLLENGADVNEDVATANGHSSLACAAHAGDFGIVKKLLDLGADINQPRSKYTGHTALSAAAYRGNLKMFDFLIRNGANAQGSAGLFALETAVSRNQLAIARRLLELGLDVNSCANGPAPLHQVTHVDMLNLLVTYGARFDLPGSEASEPTALQRAAQWHAFDLVTELVRLGSDVHLPGPATGGRSALQAAATRCRYGTEESVCIMRFLVEEHGVDVNEPRSEEEEYTSLETACQETAQQDEHRWSIEGVKFLVEQGAVITPFTLHVATAWNHTKLLDFLLQNGVRIEHIISPANIRLYPYFLSERRKFGATVIETARINGHLALAEALETWSPSTQLEIHSGEGDLDREDPEREYPDREDSH